METFGEALFTPPTLSVRDLRDGPQLRMKAYKQAWDKIYNRLLVRSRSPPSDTSLTYLSQVGEPRTEKARDTRGEACHSSSVHKPLSFDALH